MNTVRQIVLEALLLRAKYTDDDLNRAAEMLRTTEAEGPVAEILDLIRLIPMSAQPATRQKAGSKPLISRGIVALRETDPEKYGILSRFEQKLRTRDLLATPEQLREFLGTLGVKKSPAGRRDANIKAVMETLSRMGLSDARGRIDAVLGRASKSSSGYKELANFIMRPNVPDEHER